jgi:hypothetical protein
MLKVLGSIPSRWGQGEPSEARTGTSWT